MDLINKLGLYAEYFNFFFQNYLIWAIILIAALILIVVKYRNAHPSTQLKSKRYVLLASIAIIVILALLIINSVKKVDYSHQKTNEFSELSY